MPQIGGPRQYVRICELKVLLPDGSEKNPVRLFDNGEPMSPSGKELLGNDAAQQ